VHAGNFNPTDIRQLAQPIQFGVIVIILMKLLNKFGLINAFWDQKLKENHAYEERFDHPYAS
jgi:hypothetical protein